MKLESPDSFVIILVGQVPADLPRDVAAQTISAGVTVALPMLPIVAGADTMLSSEAPKDLLARLLNAVPPTLSLDERGLH